jgi:formylglycine-generating enzyme required for sulfatase activity
MTISKAKWMLVGLAASLLCFQTVQAGAGREGQKNPKEAKPPKLSMSFVKVKPGQFKMGCSKNDVQCGEDEKPVHTVRITKPFEIGRYEVSQEEWQKILGIPSGGASPAIPVEGVNWDDVQGFLQKLNDRHDGYTYRLPTEAEWEYAARGGNDTPHGVPGDVNAWHRENADNHPHPVGKRMTNFFGLYDTEGNAAEWVQDWYDPAYYQNSPGEDPPGPSEGQHRVVRGGSWNSTPRDTRVSARASQTPDDRSPMTGFRVVRVMISGQK